jgi:hypothetical protein
MFIPYQTYIKDLFQPYRSAIFKSTRTVRFVPSRFANVALRNRGYATSLDLEGLLFCICFFMRIGSTQYLPL